MKCDWPFATLEYQCTTTVEIHQTNFPNQAHEQHQHLIFGSQGGFLKLTPTVNTEGLLGDILSTKDLLCLNAMSCEGYQQDTVSLQDAR